MEEVSAAQILALAKKYQAEVQAWHYHLLTPTCQFNKTNRYAVLLESTIESKQFIHHSSAAEMELSNVLSGMLHGEDVLRPIIKSKNYQPSNEVKAILHLIDELELRGAKWHHHVLFPGCVFNASSPLYELLVENAVDGSRVVSISTDEPKEDLKQIEERFYKQQTV